MRIFNYYVFFEVEYIIYKFNLIGNKYKPLVILK
jgi:hypothetical protein